MDKVLHKFVRFVFKILAEQGIELVEVVGDFLEEVDLDPERKLALIDQIGDLAQSEDE